MDKLIPRNSCCFGFVDHRVGVLAIAATYAFFSLVDAIVLGVGGGTVVLVGIIPAICN